MGITFYADSEENMIEEVRKTKEVILELRRYVVMGVEMYSSEGNKYIYLGQDYDHVPSENELRELASAEVSEYEDYNGHLDTEAKENKINEYMQNYIVVDLEAILKGE